VRRRDRDTDWRLTEDVVVEERLDKVERFESDHEASQGAVLHRVDTPTLIIWGDQDRYLGRELAEPDRAWVPNARVERITEASHWLQADAPERVNQLILDFLEPIRS
jgi:pimeloyl-ACP methyl ester carboxylesterase